MNDTKAGLAALNAKGGRKLVHDAQMVLKLPSSIKDLVGKVAEEKGVSEATVMRYALSDYLERLGYRA